MKESSVEAIAGQIRALGPANDEQRGLQSRAEQIGADVAQARWIGFEEVNNRTPAVFLVVLVSWLAAMFASFGLFAPRNATAATSLVIGALSVATAIFLIEEMSHPLDGMIAVPSAPLRSALTVLDN